MLRRHYKHETSGYKEWDQLSHAEDYCLYPQNMGAHLSIDEVSLSKGELYTVVTNKSTGNKNKKTVVAIINGTEASVIRSVLEKIPLELRNQVKEVSMDMARNMASAIESCFPRCSKVIDRFHVVRLVLDALQHVRVKLRWEAMEQENEAIKRARASGNKYQPEILSNGDTRKELLARSKYLLYKFEEDWTLSQSRRAAILFDRYPIIKAAYKLVSSFRTIYKEISREKAMKRIMDWKQKVLELKIEEFNTVVNSLEYHMPDILNYFNNRSTNAYAESF